MISRRNFFTITILMIVILFLCMFTNNLKDMWNEYEKNPFVTGTAEDYPSQVSMFVPEDVQNTETSDGTREAGTADGKKTVLSSRGRVDCIGGKSETLTKVVREWSAYTKRNITEYESLSAYSEEKKMAKLPEMLVIDSEYVDWGKKEEVKFLMKCVEDGTNLIFATLPDVSVIRRSKDIRELLGIRKVEAAETTVDGIHMYGGFLLGGEVLYQAVEKEDEKYQDMELTFPWYSLASGTKVYMKGIPEDEAIETEDYPVVVWRKSFGSAYVFAVNGNYMEDITGLGFLSAMSAEMYPYEIYPVVNAQSVVFAGYPGLADENSEEIQEYYARSMKLLCEELLWPNITAALTDYSFGITCMLTPQYDYTDDKLPDPEQFQYFLKTFRERSAEMGLSGLSVSDTPVTEKLAEDEKFIWDTVDGYQFSSFYAGDMEESETKKVLEEDILSSVRTVVTDSDEKDARLFKYLTEHVTAQRAVSDGLSYSFRSDLRVRSVETALGYLGLSCDMEHIVYPKSDSDSWDERYKAFIRGVNVYGQVFEGFDGTTVTECDSRIRNFLALDYTDSRTDNKIHLEKKGTEGTAWFIFRNYGNEIKEVEGGSFKELEEGVYLIEAQDSEIEISLEPADERFYY